MTKLTAFWALVLILILSACAAPPEPTATVAPTEAPTEQAEPTDAPTEAAAATEAPEPTATTEAAQESETTEEADPTAEPEPEPEPTETVVPTETPVPTIPRSEAEIEEAYAPLLANATSLTDDQVLRLMYDLTDGNRLEAAAALEVIAVSEDERFVPVLIEMIRFTQLGIVRGSFTQFIPRTLQDLSGEKHGHLWDRWVEWYGNTDIEPHPDFIEWKGRSLSVIDARFAQFFVSSHPSRLRPEEVQWGGVQLDGIPALDQSPQIPAAEATYLEPQDPVFGIAINGEAHAYPLKIIDWHEMANDVVGGTPVSLAYCTLCGAAVAYNTTAADGTVYDFGSSGFLYRSNKLMYDRQTLTLWNQLTGEPVLGELAGTDLRLDLLPVVLTSWEAWQEQHPGTLVLSEETGFRRDYAAGAAYGRYFSDPETMFPVAQRADLLETKDQIYALQIDGEPKAYPIELIAESQVINDVHAGTNVVVVGTRGIVNVGRVGSDDPWYSAGSEVRVFDRGDREFFPTDDPDVVVDGDDNEWQITEEGLINADGEMAERLPGHLAYWFGWFAFFPNTAVYGQ